MRVLICSIGAYGPQAGHNTGCWGSQCSAYRTKDGEDQGTGYSWCSCTVTGSLASELGDSGSTDSTLVESCITILCPWTGGYKSSRQAHFRLDRPPASIQYTCSRQFQKSPAGIVWRALQLSSFQNFVILPQLH